MRILLLVGLVFTLIGCDNRSIDTQRGVPGSLVSIENFSEVYKGGVCPLDGSAVVEARCVKAEDMDMRPYIASNVKVTGVVTPAQSGGGYYVRLNWTHDDPTRNRDEMRVDWTVHLDDQNRNMPARTQLDSFLDGLNNRIVAVFEQPEYVSQKLLAGKVYTFYLSSNILGGSTAEQTLVLALTLNARIVVDLRSVQGPQ